MSVQIPTCEAAAPATKKQTEKVHTINRGNATSWADHLPVDGKDSNCTSLSEATENSLSEINHSNCEAEL